MQHREDRVAPHPPIAKRCRALQQISLPWRQPDRHDHTTETETKTKTKTKTKIKKDMPVILIDPHPNREHSSPRKTPAT
jgi:thioredoxin reductase